MKAYIAFCPLGIFACDEKGKMITKFLFEKDPFIIAKRLYELGGEDTSEIEKKLLEEFEKKGYNEFIFEVEKKEHKHEIPNICGEFLRSNLERLAKEYGFVKESKSEFVKFMSSINFELSKLKLREMEVNDKLAIHLAEAIDELNKSINLLVLRLREWYGMYYPELVYSKENEEIVKYVVEKLYRDRDSVGHEVSREDLEVIKKLASKINELYELKNELEEELEKKMKEIMPNTTHLVGAGIAASLLIHAGSLEKLARFPSSTIQVLGAEKALFRYLSGKGKAPKHGVLFLSKYVQDAPVKLRGKMARKLASKISMAAKVDYFDMGKKFIADKLKKELDEELKKIKSKGEKK